MDLRQLRHFVALAEEMHFGRAADRMCISQPALSVSIARLEEAIGVRLFDRDSKRVQITPAGELMLRSAREMLNQDARTEAFARAIAAGKAGRIEVGFTAPVLTRGIDKVILDCHREDPDIEFVMREFPSLKQMELVRSSRLDAGLVSLPLPPGGMEYLELFDDRFVLCLPSNHPLASRTSIDIALLRSEPFVMPSRDALPTTYDQLIGLCAGAGFHPTSQFEAASLLTTVQLVAAGLGAGFVVESLGQLGIRGVAFVPLARPLPRRSGYFIWNAERIAPGLQALIDAMRRFGERASEETRAPAPTLTTSAPRRPRNTAPR
jgi:DNA-binding transcriptional LysR family regulator